MKLTKLAKLATVSALALGCAYDASPANAAAYELGTTTQVNVNVTVDNLVQLTLTDVKTGDVGVTGNIADTATLVLNANGSITEDIAGAAHFISDDSTGVPGTVSVTGAFVTTDLYVTYDVPNNIIACAAGVCSGAAPTPTDFLLTDVFDDLATAGKFSTSTQGKGTTSTTGVLAWNIGVEIKTKNLPGVANIYESGTYTGSFDMIIAY